MDDSDANEGEATGTARTMQLVPPFYVGGIAQDDVEDAALNLKVRALAANSVKSTNILQHITIQLA